MLDIISYPGTWLAGWTQRALLSYVALEKGTKGIYKS